MARRPGPPADRAKSRKRLDPKPREPSTQDRGDDLAKLLEHCSAAQVAANALGEKFLAYLLAMAVEEVRATLRQTTPTIEAD